MIKPKQGMMRVLLLVIFITLLTIALAECPNGCSGNGDCMAKDMCNCYKNYQGNDCADRTCLFGRAHIDTPKGDINMDQSRSTPDWILANSQQHPAQTYEYFSPDALADEAHFYMECSNKGICDRTTGLCQCFDGYEGNGCQRTTCPAKCNGHGTCESIRELGVKNKGTLFGIEGAAGAITYDLWDSNSTYGCRCDPWFFGPDCNKRNCKVGVDPLYLSVGTPTYETFVIHAGVAAGGSLTNAWIRLRLFDYYGESYITTKISVLDDSTAGNPALNAAAVTTAITSVPNLTFKKVLCEATGAGTSLTNFKSARPTAAALGMSVTCQYVGNPGRMRIPEIASMGVTASASVVTTTQQGRDEDWFTVKSSYLVNSISADGLTITLTVGSPDAGLIIPLVTAAQAGPPAVPAVYTPRMLKVGPHIVLGVASGGTGTVADPYTITLKYAMKHTIGSSTPIFLTDPITLLTITTADALSAALAIGSDQMTFAAAPTLFSTGDRLFYNNAFFHVQEFSNDGLATPVAYYARMDKPFGGDSAAGAAGAAADKPYKVVLTDKTKPYKFVSECSGRGMCGYDSGICTCFKGYTNDNCDTQNILAL